MNQPTVTPETSTTPEQTQARVTKRLLKKGEVAVAKNTVALKTLTVVYVNINELKSNYYNPNRQSDHDFQLLIKSMEEDGFTQPIVAVRITSDHLKNEKFATNYRLGDAVICDGEHRWRAASTLGYEQVPVCFAPMSVEQMMTATLRHNRARGSENIELAVDVLRDLAALGSLAWAKDSLMLDDTEVEKLLSDVPAPEALAAAEFGEAWKPEMASLVQSGSAVSIKSDVQGATIVSASTIGAIEAQRQLERDLKKAVTDEDRKKVLAERKFFRVHFTFSGDEAKVVEEGLGKRPAERLVELCRSAGPAPETGTEAGKPPQEAAQAPA